MNSSVTIPVRYVTADMEDEIFYTRWTLFEEQTDGS